jgi:phosphomannomutase
MPEISRFYGIVIKMFFDEHNPPHFHAFYGGHEVLIDIKTLALFAGRFPPRALGLVIEWATLHQEELLSDWDRARLHEPPVQIEPLR